MMATIVTRKQAVDWLTATLEVVLSGFLMGVSLPPHDLPLAFVALAPFFAALWVMPRLMVLLMGLLHGWLAGLTVMGFVLEFQRLVEALPFLIYGLAVGVVGLIARDVGDLSRLRAVLLIGAAGTLLEYLVGSVFIPFHVALAVWRDVPFLQLAMVTGAWGLSLLLWGGWGALGYALAMRRWTPALTAMLLIVAAIHLLGAIAAWWSESRGTALRVAAVQGEPTDPVLIQQVRQSGAQFAVIPELSIAEWEAVPLTQQMGIPVMVAFGSGDYNCAAVAFPGGRMTQPYHKMHPYIGENSIPGTQAEPLLTPFGPVGAAICYDTMFTDTVRQLCQKRVVLIGVPTYDPTAGNLAFHHLHGAIHTIRAAEHRVPIVRSESRAVSLIVNRVGRVVAESPEMEPTVLTATVRIAPSGTLYTLLGDYLPWLCALALILGVIQRRRHA